MRGRPPGYLTRTLGTRLTPLAIGTAVCEGLWLPRMQSGFVPQGVAVSGDEAWISGFDPGRVGHRFCRVLRIDLGSARLLDELGPVTGAVGPGPDVVCRHGGGLMLDDHGLWLTELERLWLLDPATLAVRRVWRLQAPVRGSFGVLDDAGRLGLGQFRTSEPATGRGGPSLLWLDLADVLDPATTTLEPGLVVGSRRIPVRAQGGTWASVGGRRGLWVASSTTRCGVLTGPNGARSTFLPGAEGVAPAGAGRLWVVSESAARTYAREGGRPVVAPLSLVDTRRLDRWPEPTCTP